MIEKFYAAHIKNTLDTASIYVRRPKPPARRLAQKKRPASDVADTHDDA
jgi:hypothetical protein